MAKTAQTANFTDILDAAPSPDDRPKSLPVGSYLCLVKGQPRHDKSSKRFTPFVEFTLIPKQAGQDVDQDDLTAWATKADGTMKRLEDTVIPATFYTTDNAIFMLNDFLEHCGIEADGRTRREMLDDTPNCEVVAYIRHEARQDGTGVQARLGKTAPADSFNAAE